MDFEDITLSVISQSQKNKTALFHLYDMSKVFKLIKVESKVVVVSHWREKEMGNFFQWL